MTSERWRRIERLYHAALERNTAGRAPFLEQTCQGDEALRREVKSLLDADHEARTFLAESALHVAAKELTEAGSQQLVGRRFGSYELLARLDVGGMGEVYRARDVRLDRSVAIKILAPQLAGDPEFARRFEREARTISQLSHPHICTLFDVGHLGPGDDTPAVDYLVLEYLEGETLAERLRHGPLSIEVALLRAIEIGEALAHAHRHGVAHGDLKPGNIIVTESGATLVDFGLAKHRPVNQAGASGILASSTAGGPPTGSRTILGTLPYMAPEQFDGRDADARTDIWAFGAVLYEMLSGRRAFGGASEARIISGITGREPEPLMAAQLAVPRELDHLVRTCMAKKPDERPATADEIVAKLRGIAEQMRDARVAHAWQKSISAALSAGAALFAVLMFGATALLLQPDTTRLTTTVGKPSIAVLYFENNTGDASLDWLRTGLADMVVTDLSQLRGVEVLGTDRLYQILSDLRCADDRTISFDTVQRVARRSGVKIVLRGSYVKAGNAIRINTLLQEAASGRIMATERVEARDESQLFASVDDLTRRISARFDSVERSGATAAPLSPVSGVDRDLAM